MASIIWTDVIGIAPELGISGAVSAGAQTQILAVANTLLNVARFDGEGGPITKLARCNVAAHIATEERRKGGGGALTGQSSGPESRTYAAPSTASEWNTTGYGRTYRRLSRRGRAVVL